MANPFSAVPTAYRVYAADRWWYGNCAWDALGICATLQTDGRIETSCPDCSDQIALEVRDQRVDDESMLFHCRRSELTASASTRTQRFASDELSALWSPRDLCWLTAAAD